ncbi:MAG: pyridoxal 5'-phosphate synthase glutaminase subunit PdxT [Planctomycetota bacterium]
MALRPVIGVLAVQGDVAEHQAALGGHGVATRRIRRPQDLTGIHGLVLPGGESTTMLRLLEIQGLTAPLRELLTTDIPVLATCAGLILLANEVVDPVQGSLGVLDIRVARNGYGRQVHSGTFPLGGSGLPAGASGVFIRSPRILSVGPDVEVLAFREEDPVLVRRGRVLAACFHPELQEDHFVTRWFLEQVHTPAVFSGPTRPRLA